MSIPRKVRDRVVEREDHCCIRCGTWAEGGSLHHRKMRSQGGRDDVTNLLLMCGSGTTGCHGWAHHNREDAARGGYIVGSFDTPSLVPVLVYQQGMTLLDDFGGYVTQEVPF